MWHPAQFCARAATSLSAAIPLLLPVVWDSSHLSAGPWQVWQPTPSARAGVEPGSVWQARQRISSVAGVFQPRRRIIVPAETFTGRFGFAVSRDNVPPWGSAACQSVAEQFHVRPSGASAAPWHALAEQLRFVIASVFGTLLRLEMVSGGIVRCEVDRNAPEAASAPTPMRTSTAAAPASEQTTRGNRRIVNDGPDSEH